MSVFVCLFHTLSLLRSLDETQNALDLSPFFMGLFSTKVAEPVDIEVALKTLEKYGGVLGTDEELVVCYQGNDGKPYYFTNFRMLCFETTGFFTESLQVTSECYSRLKKFRLHGFTRRQGDGCTLDLGSLSLVVSRKPHSLHKLTQLLGDKICGSPQPMTQPALRRPSYVGAAAVPYSQFDRVNELGFLSPDESLVNQKLKNLGLLMPQEKVELILESMVCTNFRLLLVDVGFFSSSTSYESYDWSALKGFEYVVADLLTSRDAFRLYTNLDRRRSKKLVERPKGQSQGNMLRVTKYFNSKLLGSQTYSPSVQWNAKYESNWETMKNFMRRQFTIANSHVLNQYLHEDVPLLQADEGVELAIRSVYDLVVFTNKRILTLHFNRHGSIYRHMSYPWETIKTIEVTSAGTWGSKMGFGFFTDIGYDEETLTRADGKGGTEVYSVNVPGRSYVTLNIGEGGVDLFSLYKYFAGNIGKPGGELTPARGSRKPSASDPVPGVELDSWQGINVTPDKSFQADGHKLLADLVRMEGFIQPQHAEEVFWVLLSPGEKVLAANKKKKETTLFTTRGVVFINNIGLKGTRTRIEFLPYDSILNFNVELGNFTEDKIGLQSHTPWRPFRSVYFLRTGNAILGVYKLLADKILKVELRSPMDQMVKLKSEDFKNSAKKLVQGNGRIKLDRVNEAIGSLLLGDEEVLAAFRMSEEGLVLTTLRIITLNFSFFSDGLVLWSVNPAHIQKSQFTQNAGTVSSFDSLLFSSVFDKTVVKIATKQIMEPEFARMVVKF